MATTQAHIQGLVAGMLTGDIKCLSKLLTLVENNASQRHEIAQVIAPHLRGIRSVGITGAPGVGKSSLISRLVPFFRKADLSLGILAADPSSPVNGGALLGDRIRMGNGILDPKVFFRSVATRGCQGGLPAYAYHVVQLLDASGKDIVILETVGAGQTDVAVRQAVDIVVLVMSTESGDSIQFMKSGILEIANIIVVNAIDVDSSSAMISELKAILAMRFHSRLSECPPVFSVSANSDIGILELYEALRLRGIGGSHG